MTLGEIFSSGGISLLVLLTLVQIAPIKLNPWHWIGAHIGKAINGDVMKEIDELNKKVEKVQADMIAVRKEAELRDIETRRVRILRFGDEMLQGVLHTKDHFDQILLDVTVYENYCDHNRDFKNEVTTSTVAHIKKSYRKCMEDKSFL